VLGYCGFFLHRYRITRKRKNAIRGMDLIAKVNQNSLGTEDQKAVSYILSSIDHSKEGLNYLIIFVLSEVVGLDGPKRKIGCSRTDFREFESE
jgi:hypothetical protein